MRELKQQLVSALLVILTVATVVAAAINFQQQTRYHLPDDGVTWVDEAGAAGDQPVAVYLTPGSPAQKAGIREGDVLVSIEGVKIERAIDATEVLARLGAWRKTEYKVLRNNEEIPANVIIGEADRDSTVLYQYAVGVVYLAIGLFVYFRRRTAPRALHFFLLCLASFMMSTFHYSGKLNNFDKVIYLGNVVSGFLAPTLFLHFCFVFPEPQKWIRRRGAAVLVYLPGLALLAIQMGAVFGWLQSAAPLLEVRWLLDRVWLSFLCAMYVAGGFVLAFQLRRAEDPVVRRQLTWLRNGALVGMLPFALFYAVPYVMGVPPNHAMNLAVLSLPLIPLTWSYAILRYRLMDVDIIFQEGYVYTLATLCVLGIFYGLIFSVSRTGDLNGAAMVALILIAAFVFQPIRNWIQEQLDRYYFYKDRYDYRRTLIEFARELGSPTDLGEMLESVADRLVRTLGIRNVAFFVWDEAEGKFQLELASNRRGRQTENVPYGLDLSFLSVSPGKPYLFFERTRHSLDVVSHEMPTSVRRSISELESDLLSAVLGARPDHRVPGREPHRYGRFSLERRCRAAGDSFRICRDRHRQLDAVPVAGAEGGRVRAIEGIFGKHRGVDPRGNSGRGSGRSGGELEFADREAHRDFARTSVGRKLDEVLPGDLYDLRARAGRRRHSEHL
jgi:two-component system NtrC family sensor kinase